MKSRTLSPLATQASVTGINMISLKNPQPLHPPIPTLLNDKILTETLGKDFHSERAEIKWY